ncbi:uncharacterized protein LOC144325502 [Podarcis muralis]
MPEVARKKIDKELALHRMAGPFSTPPFPNLHVSPLGIVPKKAPGEFRLIHNLSHPRGTSVNDVIPPELCSVRYASLDHAIKMIRKFGPGALLAKCDIESAFRLLPIHPADFWLLGFQFEGGFYFDKAMPMGCSVACAAFERFSSFLEWALRARTGLDGVTHYLDDFLVASASNTGDCVVLLQAFASLTEELGVPLAAEKTEGPSTQLTYLGILLDTVAQTSSLPADKIITLRRVIEELVPLRKVTLRQLQSLLGHLNFACRVVAPGRPFCSRLARLTSGLQAPQHRVRLSSQVRADLSIWMEFLEEFNAVIEINENPNIVLNMSFGFHLYESYLNARMTYQNTLKLLSTAERIVPNFKCDKKRNMIAVIGAVNSDVSLHMTTILGIYKIPQI